MTCYYFFFFCCRRVLRCRAKDANFLSFIDNFTWSLLFALLQKYNCFLPLQYASNQDITISNFDCSVTVVLVSFVNFVNYLFT